MSGEKILVADDDRVILMTVAEGLTGAGYRVVTARDGLQALALCKSEHPDLALLDIRMPGLDGIALAQDVCREVEAPVLFLSAYDDEDLVKRAVDSGALAYLSKPASLPSILLAVRVALARAAELAALKQREESLEGALASNRVIATAIGMIMQESRLGQQEAFERLRRSARNRRMKLEELARAVVENDERIE